MMRHLCRSLKESFFGLVSSFTAVRKNNLQSHSKHVTSLCQPMQRNCTERQGWRHVPEDEHTQRTVCPCLAPPFLQYEAHRVPRGPYKMVVGVVHEALTSKTPAMPPSWQLTLPQWVVGLNVLSSSAFHFPPRCCCRTAVVNHQGQALHL